MNTVEVDGEEYELLGNPSMRTVKYVQELQINILQDYIDDDIIMQMESMDDDEFMSSIMESEGGIQNLKDMMWDNQLLDPAQTIILATDHRFTLDEFEDMNALKFKELKDVSEVALGSQENPQTAADFMQGLGVGMSSQLSQIQERAEQMAQERAEGSQTSSQSQLLQE